MARFKRLTDEEARSLTRAELLDQVEAESAYWDRVGISRDPEGYREFSRIMHAYLDPAGALAAARAVLEGRPSGYWETRPAQGGAGA